MEKIKFWKLDVLQRAINYAFNQSFRVGRNFYGKLELEWTGSCGASTDAWTFADELKTMSEIIDTVNRMEVATDGTEREKDYLQRIQHDVNYIVRLIEDNRPQAVIRWTMDMEDDLYIDWVQDNLRNLSWAIEMVQESIIDCVDAHEKERIAKWLTEFSEQMEAVKDETMKMRTILEGAQQ